MKEFYLLLYALIFTFAISQYLQGGTRIELTKGALELKWPAAPGSNFIVKSATSLTGEWRLVRTDPLPLVAASNEVSITLPVSSSTEFYQVFQLEGQGLAPQLRSHWPEEIRGPALDVAMAWPHAFLAVGSGVQVYDVSNPEFPLLIGSYRGNVDNIQIEENLAFVRTVSGITILDVSAPKTPEFRGQIDYAGASQLKRHFGASPLQRFNDLLFVQQDDYYTQTVCIYNIAELSSPTLVTNMVFTLPNYRLQLDAPYLYVWEPDSSNNWYWTITNWENPIVPVVVGTNATQFNMIRNSVGVAFRGLGPLAAETVFYDLSNPLRPTILRSSANLSFHLNLFKDNFGYGSDFNNGLQIVSLTNDLVHTISEVCCTNNFSVSQNVVGIAGHSKWWLVDHRSTNVDVHQFAAQGPINDVAASPNAVYMATPSALEILDTQVFPPRIMSTLSGPFERIARGDRYLFAAITNRILAIDTDDPAQPSVISTVGFGSFWLLVDGPRIIVFGAYGYDVSDVYNPIGPDVLITPNSWLRGPAAVADGYLYAFADDRTRVVVYDVVTPSLPFYISTIGLPGECVQLRVLGGHLFALSNPGGLTIFDIRDPYVPRYVSRYTAFPRFTFFSALQVSGTNAYLLEQTGLRMFTINLRDIQQPYLAGETRVPFEGKLLVTDSQLLLYSPYKLLVYDLWWLE
jgi:hypothetical protein